MTLGLQESIAAGYVVETCGAERTVADTKHQTSRLSGLHRDEVDVRRRRVEEAAGLSEGSLEVLDESLAIEQADKMVENVVGIYGIPVGVATNFLIDGCEVLVPMAVEEPSVVAAASNGALRARAGSGFATDVDESLTVAQIQILGAPNVERAVAALHGAKNEMVALANETMPELGELGGGARDIEVRVLEDRRTVVLHLIVDCLDAMGANAVNTMAEGLAPRVEELTGGRVALRILTNLADRRLARARCTIPVAALGRRSASGIAVRDGVVAAYEFAALDPYRAATHNKGIMNGIDAVAIATGNDWRAIEAGAHAFASRHGKYGPLTRWWVTADGDLAGEIELPLAVGTVGGSAQHHRGAKLARKILGVDRARDLAGIIAAVGLAQNLSALSALATEGIQEGHMALHARSVALSAGAEGDEIDVVVNRLRKGGPTTVAHAHHLLSEIRGES